jgi:hypothetical protein
MAMVIGMRIKNSTVISYKILFTPIIIIESILLLHFCQNVNFYHE